MGPTKIKNKKKAGRGLFSKIEGRGSVTRCQESVASFFPLNYFFKNATFSKKRERRKRQFSHIALQKSSVWRASQIYKKQKGKQFFPSQCYSSSVISSVIQPAVCPELFHQLCFQLPVVYRYRLANWFDKNILIIFVAQVLRFFLKSLKLYFCTFCLIDL